MKLEGLGKIEDPDFYLDLAFKKAAKTASEVRSRVKGERLKKSKQIELKRIDVIKKELIESLDRIIKSYPSFDNLHIFYQDAINLYFSLNDLKRSLGALNWCAKRIREMHRLYTQKIKRCKEFRMINRIRRSFSGRISSLVKQVGKDLSYLEQCRKLMKGLPDIKTRLYTVAIAGFPNVGKSTLLSRLSKSKPEIQSYPFTTRKLNLGYLIQQHKKIQLIDTPGTLDRFQKMNIIEKMAALSIKYVADMILYVFDLTEASYPMQSQIKLYSRLKKEYRKPILIYLSKTDMFGKEARADAIEEFRSSKRHREFREATDDIEELKRRIIEISKKT